MHTLCSARPASCLRSTAWASCWGAAAAAVCLSVRGTQPPRCTSSLRPPHCIRAMPSQLVPCACACAVLPWQGEVAFLMGLLQRMLEEEAEELPR